MDFERGAERGGGGACWSLVVGERVVEGGLLVVAEETDGPGENEGAAQFERGAEDFGAGDERH